MPLPSSYMPSGVPAPHLMAWLTILIEVCGGLAVLLGALVPLASLPMAAVLLVAIFTVHLPYGFSSIKLISVTSGHAQLGPPGYETNLLYLACLAALVLGGSGPMAIDGYLRRKRWLLSEAAQGCGIKPDLSRNLSGQACHEAHEVTSVGQLLIIDRPIACRVRGSFNAEDRAALLHA